MRLMKPMDLETPMDKHKIINKLYETELKLYDHFDPVNIVKDPYGYLRVKPEESYLMSSHLWDQAKKYRDAQISARYNLSFLEYINLPMPIVAILDRLAFDVFADAELAEVKRRAAQAEELQNEVAAENKKGLL